MAELPKQDAALLLRGLDESLCRLHQSATIRALEVLGEAPGEVSAATRAARPDIPWREITGMRHRLIHGYADVRLDLVWMVLRDHLKPLIAILEQAVPDQPRSGS